MLPNGLYGASSDPEQRRRWLLANPEANLAVRTGKDSAVWVLDVDGTDAEEELARLQAMHGPLPHTPIAETGNGRHLYFAWPVEGPAPQTTTKVNGLGLDVRAEGAYVIAPPSRHASGRLYRWSANGCPPAPAPAWLLNYLEQAITGPRMVAVTGTTDKQTCDNSGAMDIQKSDNSGALNIQKIVNSGTLNNSTEQPLANVGTLDTQKIVNSGTLNNSTEQSRDDSDTSSRKVNRLTFGDVATSAIGRAVAYLAKVPPAISGQGGHAQTYAAARAVVWGFDLGPEVGLDLLLEHYNPLCAPPWSEEELRHKCADAHADPFDKPRGYLLHADPGPQATVKVSGPSVAEGAKAASSPQDGQLVAYRPIQDYKPFPTHALPAPLAEFVRQGAAAIGCDAGYLALPALSVVASAIGNTRSVRLKNGWNEPCVVWTAVIGESGTLKSPPYLAVLEPIRQRNKELLANYQALQAQHDLLKAAMGKKASGPPALPPQRRVWCSDITIEKLVDLLADNPRGLLVSRDELAGWVGSFSRYKGKAGGSDLPNWLEMFRAGPVIVDRKTGDRKTIYVPNAAVSITGGLQPRGWDRLLQPDMLDPGLVARLLVAWPPRRKKVWTEAEIAPEVQEAYARCITQLLALGFAEADGGPAPHVLNLSPEGKAAWIAFYTEWAEEQLSVDGELAAAFSKLEAYAARLALLHHVVTLVDLGTDDTRHPIGEKSVLAGVTLAKWFAEEARRLYDKAGESPKERDTSRLVSWITAHGGRATVDQVRRSSRRFPTAEVATHALDALVAGGLGHWETRATTGQGGRPTREIVLHVGPCCP
jgi:hypothetical protein